MSLGLQGFWTALSALAYRGLLTIGAKAVRVKSTTNIEAIDNLVARSAVNRW